MLADALGVSRKTVTGTEKLEWARAIAPYMNFNEPRSPSLRKLVEGTGRYLAEMHP
jgi:DNA-binding XRE family transcriptional regulator